MARQIKIESGVLNVRVHPHSPDRYVELLKLVYRLKNIVKLRGDRYAMISLLDSRNTDGGYVAGLLATFVNVEFDGSWFDTEKLGQANSDDLSEVNIPENLRPNLATFRFYFDINSHRLYFQTYTEGKTLTPASAFRVFSALFDDLKVGAYIFN